MNGTDRNAPPAPTMLETTPMVAPAPNSPALPGSWRNGFGSMFISIRAAETPVNTPNSAASSPEDMPATICGPTSDPSTMPGASAHTTRQRTAPRRACARMLEIDVNMIVASEVATAM